jgi:hypothetical protein
VSSRLTLDQIRAVAAQVGFPDPALAAAVAMAESGGYTNAVGDVDLGKSIGLWQINLPSHPQYDPQALLDPTYNARAALAISSGGTDWSPWTTFRSGAYKTYYSTTHRDFVLAASIAILGGAIAYGIHEGTFDSVGRDVNRMLDQWTRELMDRIS